MLSKWLQAVDCVTEDPSALMRFFEGMPATFISSVVLI